MGDGANHEEQALALWSNLLALAKPVPLAIDGSVEDFDALDVPPVVLSRMSQLLEATDALRTGRQYRLVWDKAVAGTTLARARQGGFRAWRIDPGTPGINQHARLVGPTAWSAFRGLVAFASGQFHLYSIDRHIEQLFARVDKIRRDVEELRQWHVDELASRAYALWRRSQSIELRRNVIDEVHLDQRLCELDSDAAELSAMAARRVRELLAHLPNDPADILLERMRLGEALLTAWTSGLCIQRYAAGAGSELSTTGSIWRSCAEDGKRDFAAYQTAVGQFGDLCAKRKTDLGRWEWSADIYLLWDQVWVPDSKAQASVQAHAERTQSLALLLSDFLDREVVMLARVENDTVQIGFATIPIANDPTQLPDATHQEAGA